MHFTMIMTSLHWCQYMWVQFKNLNICTSIVFLSFFYKILNKLGVSYSFYILNYLGIFVGIWGWKICLNCSFHCWNCIFYCIIGFNVVKSLWSPYLCNSNKLYLHIYIYLPIHNWIVVKYMHWSSELDTHIK